MAGIGAGIFAKIGGGGGELSPCPPCSNGPERQTSLMLFILCYIFLYIQESKCFYTSLDGKMLPIAILLFLFVITSATTLQLAPRECYQTNVPFCYPWTLNWFTPSFTCRYEFVKNFPYGYSYPPGNFVAF